ncbi:ferredoxin [bacterium CG17_big_fil_post_rev_8_21_14_2_50_64_8]|nr:MAG: ferredoxin [bacterium CG17_big_fil_post_rev_8_21_14_2_50_64_8]PJA74765.1 MAG: ferredoxin [bacterium CG_4_9_14_3_um_filter_65_15]
MLKFPVPFATTVFVCTNKRPDGHPKPCCANRGGLELREELRQMVRDAGLEGQIRVFKSGCLGCCEQGPMALKFPDGELMMGIKPEDLPMIFADLASEE